MQVHGDGGMPQKKEEAKAITARQAQYLEAYRASCSAAKAASIVGVSTDTIREALRRVARNYGKASIKELLDDDGAKHQSATAKQLMKLIKQQDYLCALSGEKLTPKTAELDHKVARSKGGTDTIENLQWLDRTINKMKGSMSVDEFVAACKRVARWNG